jgi:hypothetical protein
VSVVQIELALVVALAPVNAIPVHAVVGVATFSRGPGRGRGRGRSLKLDAVVNFIFGASTAAVYGFVALALLANQITSAVSIVVAVANTLSHRGASRSPTVVSESTVVGRQIRWIVAVVKIAHRSTAATWN